jgi:hypothetical protein
MILGLLGVDLHKFRMFFEKLSIFKKYSNIEFELSSSACGHFFEKNLKIFLGVNLGNF